MCPFCNTAKEELISSDFLAAQEVVRLPERPYWLKCSLPFAAMLTNNPCSEQREQTSKCKMFGAKSQNAPLQLAAHAFTRHPGEQIQPCEGAALVRIKTCPFKTIQPQQVSKTQDFQPTCRWAKISLGVNPVLPRENHAGRN